SGRGSARQPSIRTSCGPSSPRWRRARGWRRGVSSDSFVSGLPPFFTADGDQFVPSASARGPWSARHQHGGPPAALLARAFARKAGVDAQVTRLTFDLLRPVPLSPLTVETRIVRAGTKVQRFAGSVLADGVPVIEATCLVMRVALDSVAVAPDTRAGPPPP